MKIDQSCHLDDLTLQMILDNETLQETDDPQTEDSLLEQQHWQHLDQCQHCQDRLVEAAADSQWRHQMSDVLRESSEATSGVLPVSDHQWTAPEKGQEFQSIQRSLQHWLEPASHPELLGRLDRYEVESFLGWGGMGVVLKAIDSELRRPVAIKMLLPRWADNGTAKQRFLREARSAAAVLHPSVIAIHGIHQTDDMPYLVMPLIIGPTLQQLVQKEGPLPERQVVQIGLQIASGLAAAHAQGVVHRDIKPGNVLLDNSVNRAVITDFGLARCQDDQVMTQTGWMAGTPGYMSPEQCRGETLDGRSDLFSLGAVLFFLCTGRSPFTGSSPMAVLHQITHGKAKDVRQHNEEISATLSACIARLLSPKREHRFTSSAELGGFLERYLQHLHSPTTCKKPRLVARRKPILIAASALALLVFGITVSYWPATSNPSVAREAEATEVLLGSDSGEEVHPSTLAPGLIRSELQWQEDWASVVDGISLQNVIRPVDMPSYDLELQQIELEMNQLQQAMDENEFLPVANGDGN